MADNTEQLAITITATDSGASAVIQDVRAKIAAIEQELAGVGVAGANFGSGLASSGATAAAGFEKVGSAARAMRTPLEEAAGTAGTLARGLDAAGLSAAGSAARVEGLAGAFEELKGAAPELLAIGAALLAIGAAFNFLKEGVGAAGDLQQSMQRLRVVVDETGGSWADAEPKITAFLDALSVVGVTADEGAAAMNRLMEAGASYRDAQSELAVGAQMVAAGIGSWEQVTNALTHAQSAGGDMMLGRLVPAVRTMIHDNDSLSQIMEFIRKKTEEQIQSGDGLVASNARLHAEWVALSELAGQALLPALTYVSQGLIGLIEATKDVGQGFYAMAVGIVESLSAAAAQVRDFLEGAVSLGKGDIIGATAHFTDVINQQSTAMRGLHVAAAGLNQALKGMGEAFHPQVTGAEKLTEALKILADAAKGVGNLENDPRAQIKGPSQASGYNAPASTQETQQTALQNQALQEQATVLEFLTQMKSSAANAEDSLANRMKLTTTSAEYQNVALALNKQKMDDLHAQLDVLRSALEQEVAMQHADQQAVIAATASHDEAVAALNRHETAADGATKQTEQWKNQNITLTAAVHNTASVLSDADNGLKTVTATIKEHTAQVQTATKAYSDLQSAPIEAIDALARKWSDFTNKSAQSLKEDLDTFSMTQSQKVQYYANVVASLDTLTAQSESDREAAFNKELSAYKAMVQEEIAARKAALATETSITSTFLNDIVVQHKSFADALKGVYESILKSFVDMVTKMVVESKTFQSIMSALGIGGTSALPAPPVAPGASEAPGQAQAVAALQTAGTQLQTAGTQLSTSATQTTTAATQTTTAATQLQSSAAALTQAAGALTQAATSSGLGGGSNAMDANNQSATWQWASNLSSGTSSSPLYVANAPGLDGSMSDPVVAGPGSVNAPGGAAGAGGASAGAVAGGALMGFGIGSSVAGMLGENTTWGGVGGAIGGAAGTMIAGPVGGMIGAAVLGAIGGLFGPHWTPAQQPDVAEPVVGGVSYGQFVSNLNGVTGSFNGQSISPQAQFAGSQMEASQLAYDIQHLPTGNNSALSNLANQLKALNSSLSASGFGVASEKNGVFTLQSGATIGVTQYMQLVSQFMSAYTGAGGTSGVPSFSLSRTYPDFNLATVRDSNGNVIISRGQPVPGGGSGGGSTGGGSGSGGSGGSGGTGHVGGGGPGIYNDFRGSHFFGPSGLEAVISELEQMLQRSQAGQIPGSVTNSGGSTRRQWPA